MKARKETWRVHLTKRNNFSKFKLIILNKENWRNFKTIINWKGEWNYLTQKLNRMNYVRTRTDE